MELLIFCRAKITLKSVLLRLRFETNTKNSDNMSSERAMAIKFAASEVQ